MAKLSVLSFYALASFLRFSDAADCGQDKIGSITDPNTWTSGQYENNYWRARQGLCNLNACANNDPVCNTVTMVMDETHALILSRSAKDPNPDYSNCFNATGQIIQQCVRDQSIVEGSWTLDSGSFSYSIKTPPATPDVGIVADDTQTSSVPISSPTSSASASATSAPTSSTPTAVFPTSTSVSCGTNDDAGARLSDCLAILGSVSVPNDDTNICTNGQGTCLQSGDSVGPDPKNPGQTINTSSFCEISGNSGCALVIANKLSDFGFPGFSCVTGSQLNAFVKTAANSCNNNGALNAYAIAQGPNGYDSLCLTSSDGPGLCGA